MMNHIELYNYHLFIFLYLSYRCHIDIALHSKRKKNTLSVGLSFVANVYIINPMITSTSNIDINFFI